jgi:hypothetical protein
MVTVPVFPGYRTRLTDLLDPQPDEAALAEASAASPFPPPAEEKTVETSFFAQPRFGDCVSFAGEAHYTSNQMTDVFSAYHQHLLICDLDPKTKARDWEVINRYRKWLAHRRPDATTAQEFLAYLRSRGYRPRSVQLYYHALRLFLKFKGIQFKVKTT